MASVYDLKPRFQALLRPLVDSLAQRGVTANQVTIAAVLLSFIGGGLIAWRPFEAWPLLLLPLILLARMGLNAIDGMLAREHSQQSKLGALLNELGDVMSDAALYLPLAWVPMVYVPLIEGIVVLAVVSEMAGVVAVQIGAKRQYQGPMGKSDRALWFGALGLALGLGVEAGNWINWGLGVMLALLVVTIVNRARGALKETHAA
ncbi:MAG: CDP-alcohol phosphatidyltransferase family protein [Betaproteobacteria bacterium]|nr:CDP-alcohol phosphatidyltransferase family protein [Betaproteobacteria bacterium]